MRKGLTKGRTANGEARGQPSLKGLLAVNGESASEESGAPERGDVAEGAALSPRVAPPLSPRCVGRRRRGLGSGPRSTCAVCHELAPGEDGGAGVAREEKSGAAASGCSCRPRRVPTAQGLGSARAGATHAPSRTESTCGAHSSLNGRRRGQARRDLNPAAYRAHGRRSEHQVPVHVDAF